MMPSNHLILCRSLLLLPSLFQHQGFFQWVGLFASGGQSIGASASASVLPEYSGLTSFKINWFVEIELPYDPAIPLLGIHTEETRIERDTCTPMFIARTWKQSRCPLPDEWIRKLWYIYTMQYYSAIRKNTFESVLMRWMKLEPILQSEVSQKEKHQYSILTYIYGI